MYAPGGFKQDRHWCRVITTQNHAKYKFQSSTNTTFIRVKLDSSHYSCQADLEKKGFFIS